jgi:hypothetical protein
MERNTQPRQEMPGAGHPHARPSTPPSRSGLGIGCGGEKGEGRPGRKGRRHRGAGGKTGSQGDRKGRLTRLGRGGTPAPATAAARGRRRGRHGAGVPERQGQARTAPTVPAGFSPSHQSAATRKGCCRTTPADPGTTWQSALKTTQAGLAFPPAAR